MDEQKNVITVPLDIFTHYHTQSVLYEAIVDGLMGCAKSDQSSPEDITWSINDLQTLFKAVCPHSYAYKVRQLKEMEDPK